jgi:hypothetical protein
MTPFQWIVVSLMACLLLWEVLDKRRRRSSPGFWLIRSLVWVSVAVAVADPLLVQRVANVFGIGLGVNFVVYLFALVFLATSFYFYSQKVAMQRQITLLTRHIALREATRGADAPPSPQPPGAGDPG